MKKIKLSETGLLDTTGFIKVYKAVYTGEEDVEMIININDIATVQKIKDYVEIKLLNGHFISVFADFEKISEAINPKKIEKSGSCETEFIPEKHTL